MKKKVTTGMNTQQEIDPKQFVRQVGIKPLQGRPSCSWPDQLDLFYEAFGPPETDNRKRPSILFWNFLESDGTPAFSLCMKSSDGRKVSLVPRLQTDTAYSDTAYLWTGDRIGEAEIEPLFLDARRFVISCAC
jgi:hypothetical protein